MAKFKDTFKNKMILLLVLVAVFVLIAFGLYKTSKNPDKLSLGVSLGIGAFIALAIFPGVSSWIIESPKAN